MAGCSRPHAMAASIRLFGATIPQGADALKELSDVGVAEEKRCEKCIPCPRCRSQDTKFCYFNNYNVNQPRHFCKSCQRYWTAGGALRNVPVGAGRRRAKPPCLSSRRLAADGFIFAASQSDPERALRWQAAAMATACDGFQEALKRRRGDPPSTASD